MKRITIHVQPRSSRNEIFSKHEDGSLKVKLTAPPVDGAANDALIKLLSEEFDIPKSRIKIVKGERSKIKVVEIDK